MDGIMVHIVIRALLFAVVLAGCAYGTAQPLDRAHPLHREIDDLATRWAGRPELPSIWTPQCARYLRDVRIYLAQPGSGAAATLVFWGSRPAILIAPEPTADGHEAAVRHEAAHLLAVCTDMGGDVFGHETAAIWDTDGIVWRAP